VCNRWAQGGGATSAGSPPRYGTHSTSKRTGIGYVTSAGYPELARHARVLATYEGFEAHANAVSEVRDALIAKAAKP
jgi:histidinol dehydrogenase